jgi:DNA repair protein RadC
MPITHWPINERPREKLLQQGPAALSDAELLAIFLRTGTPGNTALDIARQLLLTFGSLRKLLTCSESDFCALPGLGPVKYAQVQAVVEMGQRFLQETLTDKPVLSCQQSTRDYLTAKLRHLNHEVFYCLFLNSQNQLIACETLAEGSLQASRVYPREVVKRCLYHNASAVIFAHNHPSGHCQASAADLKLTQALQEALGLMDISVHDHLVIGDGEVFSFAERGWL